MTHIVILTTWAAQRPAPDATEHMHFFDHDGFVALDSTSSRPEGPNAPRQLAAEVMRLKARLFDLMEAQQGWTA